MSDSVSLSWPDERLDLAALGGDLAGVGEVLVEVEVGVVAVPEARQLLADAAPLFLELVAQHRVGRVRHGSSLLPALRAGPRFPARARGWAAS